MHCPGLTGLNELHLFLKGPATIRDDKIQSIYPTHILLCLPADRIEILMDPLEIVQATFREAN